MPRRPTPEFNDRWVDAREAAELLGVTLDIIRHDTVKNNLGLPRYQLAPKIVRFRLSELVAWAEARRVKPPVRADLEHEQPELSRQA